VLGRSAGGNPEHVVGHGLSVALRHSKPSKTTQSENRAKLLPLTGQQFRSSVYEIPSDNEDDDEGDKQYVMAGGLGDADGAQSRHVPMLRIESDNEAVQSDNHKSTPDAIKTLRCAFLTHSKKSKASKTITKSKTKAKAPTTEQIITDLTNVSDRMIQKNQKPSNNRSAANIPNHRSPSKHHHVTPARRLPVNELFLVASRPDDVMFDPASSYPDMSVKDPIIASSSSPLKHNSPSVSSIDGVSPRKVISTPLTTIRQRIRASRWRYKPLTTSRKRAEKVTALTQIPRTDLRGRDGFETFELAICSRPGVSRKPRLQTPLIQRFDVLQLGGGLLPEVAFESTIKTELRTQLDIGHEALCGGTGYGGLERRASQNGSEMSHLRGELDDHTLENRIRAELSSVSAPPRPRSEYDSDGDFGDHSEDDKVVGDEDSDITHPDVAMNGAIDKANVSYAEDEATQVHCEPNQGVTLDFRRPERRGQTAISHSLRRRKLIEVNESII
jgi:hypothetical protein